SFADSNNRWAVTCACAEKAATELKIAKKIHAADNRVLPSQPGRRVFFIGHLRSQIPRSANTPRCLADLCLAAFSDRMPASLTRGSFPKTAPCPSRTNEAARAYP